jgi:transcriptional regulator with XRE-family HTH domain
MNGMLMSVHKDRSWHNTFSRRLKVLREDRQLTQKQLADMCGLDHTKISIYERGDSRPTLEHFRSIVIALDVPAGHLLSTE